MGDSARVTGLRNKEGFPLAKGEPIVEAGEVTAGLVIVGARLSGVFRERIFVALPLDRSNPSNSTSL